MATACSGPTSSTIAATSRWGAPGTTSTSLPSGARSNGRIRRRAILPLLLAPEGSDVEVVPGAPHLLVAAIVDEVGPEHAVAIANERVGAVPLVHAEVFVELVRQRVPRDVLPAHPRLQAFDVRLRSARREHQRGIAGVQMCGVSDLVGYHGAANAAMLGPAFHAGLEEGAVNDQLTAAIEEVEQTRFAIGPVELILLLHGHPRHPPTLGRQRITSAGQLFLHHEQFLPRTLPLLRGHHFRYFHVFLFFMFLFLFSLFRSFPFTSV